MNYLNRVWRVGAFALVVGLMAAACADDQGAVVGGPPVTVTGSISGTVKVVGTGAPIVGALVGTTPATSTALTDAAGNYRIDNIPIPASGSAAFAVTASHSAFTTGAAGTRTVTLTTAAPNATANLELNAPAGPPPPLTTGNLNVLVTNSAGVPQSGAAVVARRQGAADSLTGTTDANGFVVFNNATAGAYTVRASKTISGIPFRASGGVNVVAGETAFIQLALGRDFGQTVFPNRRGDTNAPAGVPTDIDFVPVAGATDSNPDIDCNIIRTQHMFIVEVTNAAGQPVSGVKVNWALNISENGTISTRCPELTDDPAGCTIPTVPGNTGSIVDSDDPDLDPFRARSGLNPAFTLDTRAAITFTNDLNGPDNTVQIGSTTVSVGEGQTWIVITSPVEGVTDVIASSSDIAISDTDCGIDEDPDTACDKDFAIKRWVNWSIAVYELFGWDDPGETRDPYDSPDVSFDEISNGGLVINVLSRGFDALCEDDGQSLDDQPSIPGVQCRLIGDEHVFLSEVERLRPDSPFNISRGRMVWTVTDDTPDVDFFGEDIGNNGDGCDDDVCNAEHNGPSDDQYWVGGFNPGAQNSPGGSVGNRNRATIEFDANNNVFDGGVFTQNPDCTAPCDEDDFIGWGAVQVRLDPTIFFCTDVDLDGDCNPGEAGGDTFSPAYAALVAGTSDNTAAFRVQFLDEFGEVCAELTFRKRYVTSRLTIIKQPSFPTVASRATIEGFPNIKVHTVLVGETFSYTITVVNDGDVRARHVRITDTLPRFGDQFSGPPDLGAPSERNGNQAFQYINDRPAFDPQAIVYGVDEDNDDPGDDLDQCIVGRQAGNANATAFVLPSICLAGSPTNPSGFPTITPAGSIAQARALAVAASTGDGDQIVFIQYYDEEILGRQEPGGGIQSEDSVEITLRALPSLYNVPGDPLSVIPDIWCNIATVTDGRFNRGGNVLGDNPTGRPPTSQSLDADTLCHEVREALLDIRKTAVDAVIGAGGTASFEVQVSNSGSANLTNVVIRDTVDASIFPPGRKLQSGDIVINTTNFPGTLPATINSDSFTFSVTLPTVTPGGFRTAFTVNIPVGATSGVFCNRVTARAPRSGGQPDLVETDIACVTVLPGAVELDITNEDGTLSGVTFNSIREQWTVGDGGAGSDEFVYEVTVTNNSTFNATSVVIVDAVSPNSGFFVCREIITAQTITPAGALAAPTTCATTGWTWTLGTLVAGGQARIRFRAEALSPGNDVNRVTLTASQLSGSVVDNEPTTIVQ